MHEKIINTTFVRFTNNQFFRRKSIASRHDFTHKKHVRDALQSLIVREQDCKNASVVSSVLLINNRRLGRNQKILKIFKYFNTKKSNYVRCWNIIKSGNFKIL